jgi:hypothetical protein
LLIKKHGEHRWPPKINYKYGRQSFFFNVIFFDPIRYISFFKYLKYLPD